MHSETPVLPGSPENILKAAQIIRDGGLVAFPTETVYGLAANALDPAAVAKIFEAKQRPSFDPLIVHISDRKMLADIAEENDRSKLLADKFWPGPLTLVLKKKQIIPDLVSSGLSTVGVRIPKNEIALQLIRAAGTPLAAPSANPFGYLSPTTAQHVYEQLNGKIDLIIDGGDCTVGVESTIISVAGEKSVLLRPGGLATEELISVLGEIEYASNNISDVVEAPGLLPWHYSPLTLLRFLEEKEEIIENENIGYLFFKTPDNLPVKSKFRILSEKGELNEAAANLFTHLHKLDDQKLEMIIVEAVTEKGLGVAIMDRLRKAAKRPQKI